MSIISGDFRSQAFKAVSRPLKNVKLPPVESKKTASAIDTVEINFTLIAEIKKIAAEKSAAVAAANAGAATETETPLPEKSENAEASRDRLAEWADAKKEIESAEKRGDPFKEMIQALKIAKRIMDGDRVPPSDEEFLLKYNAEMYTQAKSAAKIKDDPEEFESLLDDDDSQSDDAESAETAEISASAGTAEFSETSAEPAETTS